MQNSTLLILYRKILLFLMVLLIPGFSYAQTSLAKWDMVGQFGPTVTPTTYLAINNGKLISAVGQTSAAFVSSGGAPTDPELICNGWNVGSGNAWFLANFSTTNFTGITFKFVFETYQFGPKNFKTQYSTTSASGAWTDFGSALNYGSTGGSGSYSFSLPAACDNQANVWVRVVTTSAPSSTGGCYIDEVEITGSAGSPPSISGHPSTVNICPSNPTSFSVTASNAINYQWEYNTGSTWANVPASSPYSGTTTATLGISSVTTAMNGYQYRCVVSGAPPAATSNAATLNVTAYGTWTGTSNTLWSNAANWSCSQVPTATTNVIINSGGNQPTIDVATATCNNLTINTGATVTFSGSTNVLDVKGNISGSGTLTATSGKLILSGTGTQTFPAGTYKDLQISGGSSKTPGGALTINGTLTLTSGYITLGANNLTVSSTGSISGGSSSAFIVTNGAGVLTIQNIGPGGKTGNVLFPVGSVSTSYTPAGLTNTGTLDNFSLLVKNGLYPAYTGTTGTGTVLSANAVNKTWFVTEGTTGGSTVNLSLSWNGTDELAGFDRNNCRLGHYSTGAWNSPTNTSAAGFDPYFVSRSGLSSFSPFGIGSAGSPLPIQLISFTGKVTPAEVQLNWSTASEEKIASFEVERSIDGNTFVKTGAVMARGSNSNYTSIDKPGNENNALYYRLKIWTKDNSFTYSNTIMLYLDKRNATIAAYPNPVTGNTLSVKLNTQITHSAVIVITDATGKTVLKQQLTDADIKTGQLDVNVRSLLPGNYIIGIHEGGDKVLFTQQFIRQ